ncbi:MAG: PH domain-containing protein [Clostridia bacterium]|nr:PH domain-containing protein [Clostridia bacterium]MBO6243032.1 PH domain-containing protein [Clostridia bacterium]
MEKIEVVWKDTRRPIFGLPLSFTKYRLLEDKLLIDTGFLSTKQEEIKLYRIMDVTLNRSFIQRIFGVGTIHCCSGDKSTPEFDIKDIKNSFDVKEKLSRMIEEQRDKKRVSGREFLYSHDDDDDLDDEDIH